MSNFMKICPVGAELFHADRRTDTTERIVALRNFAKSPKMLGISMKCQIRTIITVIKVINL